MGLRRLFVYLIAAAFVLNGAAMRAWADVPTSLVPSMQIEAVTCDGDHHGHAGQSVLDPSSDEGSVPDHSNNCLKCCTMCNAAGMTPEAGGAAVLFAYADAAFDMLQGDLIGQLVAVDPHIPKIVV